MRLTAVVPATDDPPTLDACRAAIASAAGPPDEVVVIREPAGAGASEARNLGAARATGDAIVFVDADVAVHPDAFDRVRGALGDRPGLTAVIGSYDDAPTERGLVSEFRNLLHHHVHQQAAGSIASFWSGLGAIRTDAFLAAGGFDTRQAWLEDVELGMRLADAGATVELDPRLLGKHLKRWTLAEMIRTDVLRRGAPWVELLMRRRAAPTDLNLSWRHRLAAASWLGAAASLATRRVLPAAACAAVAAAANRAFYSLLALRLGRVRALAGFLLHGVHYLAAAASVPIGVVAHLRRANAPKDLVQAV